MPCLLPAPTRQLLCSLCRPLCHSATLMELGVGPIVTGSMILQLLQGAKILDVGNGPADRALFNGASKLLAVIMTAGQSAAYILAGMYGPVSELGMVNALLLFGQLLGAGLVILYLDELLQRGYGLGSAISLNIAAGVCTAIVQKSLSPTTYNVGNGTQFEGAIIAFFHLMITKENKLQALSEAFTRPNMPNLSNLLATVVVFFVVIYLQGFKYNVPIRHRRVRGQEGSYPIKLFYSSNIPVILQTALVSNLYFVSQLLYKRFGGNPLVRLLGRWTEDTANGTTRPEGGLAYYMSPPGSFADMANDPFHALFFIVFVLASCGLFSRWWIEISGQSTNDVTTQLLSQDMVIAGRRDDKRSVRAYLDNYIPIAAAFGGMCVGGLSVFADLTGAVGSGTGILLAVTITFQIYEEFAKQRMSRKVAASL